ncbi:MAG: pyridoxal phosphate-dependent aminotransferase [Desulfobacteraceae bacterium]|nr:MAG: pyridoxal phosphate-dependent aminotransferase [Desulfobacteraceae bacterium]
MPIADRMIARVAAFGVIKDMFEEGRRMKAEFGSDNVYDFSLGNPDVPPPDEFRRALNEMTASGSLDHGYAPVTGHLHVREALARRLQQEQGVAIPPDLILMTVGAAGALNDILRALMNPGEEFITPAPYFLGYENYAFLADAALVAAPTNARFHLDVAAIEKALSFKTRVVLINSPNNPSGAVYSAAELKDLGDLLQRASVRFGKRVYLVADEPYRRIVYDVAVPSVFAAYPHSIVVNSFSKELSLAGERIGYLAVHPAAEDSAQILAAAAAINSMNVVNAPSLFQQAAARVLGAAVDVSSYRRRRDKMAAVLDDAGYQFTLPEGAFYLFPKSPVADDVRFTRLLKEERILVSPGRAFGVPGCFRISYAVPEAVIAGSREGFRRALQKAQG